jgi:hypothetical protein
MAPLDRHEMETRVIQKVRLEAAGKPVLFIELPGVGPAGWEPVRSTV